MRDTGQIGDSTDFKVHRPCVTLITATGDRQESLLRCQQFVSRFRHTGTVLRVQWLVVDDGQKQSQVSVFDMQQISHETCFEFTYVRPEHRWQMGMNTLALNLLAAIPKVQHEFILFIEDDDWYHPDYLWSQIEKLQEADIVGEIPARYYHVPTSQYKVLENRYHASLCQTGIRRGLLPVLQKICEDKHETSFIDVRLWNRTTKNRQALVKTSLSVGMKGLPGRPGIGIGHRSKAEIGWILDTDQNMLKSWIGTDIDLYEPYIPQISSFTAPTTHPSVLPGT